MDMNTRRNKLSSETELVCIGGIGFMFEVRTTLKHNLISPDVIAFFYGVPESGEVTKDCAFPLAISDTNIQSSLFQNLGYDWVVCFDGVFRKIQRIRCEAEYKHLTKMIEFYIDRTISTRNIASIISL